MIMISGLSDQEQAQSLISQGAFDYLLKPFRLEVVEDSVNRALERSDNVMPRSSTKDTKDVSTFQPFVPFYG